LDKSAFIIKENTHEHLIVQIMSDTAAQNKELSFHVHRNASLLVELMIAHVDTSISITCNMEGESSNADIRCVYIVKDANNITIISKQHHVTANATSNVVIKGVLYDSAQVHYSGMIRVEKNAYATKASQENKNIVLSDNARALSVPQLEVLTNDVHCFHASATGKFDHNQLFYCKTRGIDDKHAQQLLLQGFFSTLFKSDVMKKSLEKYIYE
jgi:Fe-S cluster assembly scaffold protein SufB